MDARSYAKIYRTYNASLEQKENTTDIDTPPSLTGKVNFVKWKKQAENYFSSVFNPVGVALMYVIRKDDQPPSAGTALLTLKDKRVACTPLCGEGYKQDNERVWTLLQQAIINGPGWPYICKFAKTKNGRMAWKSLLGHFMSDGVMSNEKKKAYDAISSTKYRGETAKFGFEQFVGTLQDLFEILAEYGEPVAESKKVRDFLDAIQVSNSHITSGMAYIQGNCAYLEDFKAASDYLAAIVKNQKDSLTRRGVSAFGRQRGGRGRNGRGKRPRIHTNNYPPKEWDKLTPEEQKMVQKLRREQKEDRSSKRKTAAARLDKDKEPKSDNNAGTQMCCKKAKKTE